MPPGRWPRKTFKRNDLTISSNRHPSWCASLTLRYSPTLPMGNRPAADFVPGFRMSILDASAINSIRIVSLSTLSRVMSFVFRYGHCVAERGIESVLRTLPVQQGLLTELTVIYLISLSKWITYVGVTLGLLGVPIRRIWLGGLYYIYNILYIFSMYALQKDEFSKCIFQWGRVFFRTSFLRTTNSANLKVKIRRSYRKFELSYSQRQANGGSSLVYLHKVLYEFANLVMHLPLDGQRICVIFW